MKQFLLTIFTITLSLGLYSQDLNYSQFYHNKTLINPAYTGLNKSMNLSGIHRNQWMGIGEGNLFQSSAFIADYGLSEKSSGKYGSGLGMGLIYQHSVTGLSQYTTDNLRLNLASDAPRIGNEKQGFMAQFPVGISIAYIKQKYDYHNLIFSDQLDPVVGLINNGAGIPDNVIAQSQSKYIDLGFGGMAGVKFHKTNKSASYLSLGFAYNTYIPINTTADDSYTLSDKWSIHGFYHQPINSYMLSSGLIYQKHGELQTMIIGTEFMPTSQFSFGLWIRNKSFNAKFSNYADLILNLSYQQDRYQVGYSYDMTISKLTNQSSKGTHEISIKIHIFNDSQRRYNKRRENNTCFFQGLN